MAVNDTASKKTTVLVIDDETQIQRFLRVCLERDAYHVVQALTGNQGIDQAIRCRPDIVLLDLGLPDIDGLEVLQRLREWTQAPILIVSVRDHETDKVTALDLGANDYITKPFSTAELLARLRVARRSAQPAPTLEVFRSGRLQVNLTTRLVKVDGLRVKLTATEYALLRLFVKHAGKVLTHGQILRELWQTTDAERIGQLRVYMAYLRDKLEKDPRAPELLLTEPGVGYRLGVDH